MATEVQSTKLSAGQLVPDFRLSAVNRDGQLGPWDYKQHRNLVLVFFRSIESEKCRQLLRAIAKHYAEYQEKEAEVLVISTDRMDRLRQLVQDLALPFPVLSDNEGRVSDLYLPGSRQAGDKAALEAAIFVADRWGAIFYRTSLARDHDLPAEGEIREWLKFIELQCEECFPSEWPV